MKEHGIFTTKADFWIHQHPLDPEIPSGAVYWYRVEAMRMHIALTKAHPIFGFSKGGSTTPTGAGFLIPKTAFFINRVDLKPRYCEGIDWEHTTDRERGQWGEQIVIALLDHGVIQLVRQISTATRDSDEQFSGIDGSITWAKEARFEAKTETYRSGNLFVQMREEGHEPNYTADGLRRETELLPLLKGPTR